MGLLDGLSTPQWQSPQQMWASSAQNEEVAAHNFAQGEEIGQKQQEINIQKQQIQQQLDMLQQQRDKVAQVSDILTGASTASDIFGRISQHPWMAIDPQTKPLVDAYTQQAVNYAKVQNGSLLAKTNLAQNKQFIGDLSKLQQVDPASYAAISAMDRNPDGTPSSNQIQALSGAQEAYQTRLQNQKDQATIDAMNRGDVPTTTVGPKGVSTTYHPADTTDLSSASMTLPDGSTLTKPPGKGKEWFHTPAGSNGTPKPLNNQQLISLQKNLIASNGTNDPTAQQIGTYLQSVVGKQVSGAATGYGGVLPMPSDKSQLKYNQKYNTPRGIATWNGNKFIPN